MPGHQWEAVFRAEAAGLGTSNTLIATGTSNINTMLIGSNTKGVRAGFANTSGGVSVTTVGGSITTSGTKGEGFTLDSIREWISLDRQQQ
jgi:hypothetical protein